MQHSHVIDHDMKNDWKLMTILVGANDVCLGLANNTELALIAIDLDVLCIVILEMCQP